MSIIPWRRVRQNDAEPAPDWDPETEAIQRIGEWLSHIPTDEGKFRALAYWLWRLKSSDRPEVTKWVEAVADESVETLGGRHGFSGPANEERR